jgi:hypothetical protein
MHAKPSYMIFLIMSFPMVGGMPRGSSRLRRLFPLKDEAPKENEEAPDLRTKSYKSTPKKCCKQEVTSQPHCNEY